jgi:hypothetical protein
MRRPRPAAMRRCSLRPWPHSLADGHFRGCLSRTPWPLFSLPNPRRPNVRTPRAHAGTERQRAATPRAHPRTEGSGPYGFPFSSARSGRERAQAPDGRQLGARRPPLPGGSALNFLCPAAAPSGRALFLRTRPRSPPSKKQDRAPFAAPFPVLLPPPAAPPLSRHSPAARLPPLAPRLPANPGAPRSPRGAACRARRAPRLRAQKPKK